MRRVTTLLSLAAATLLTATVAAPAHAIYIRPSTANLKDAAGGSNGCVTSIPAFELRPWTGTGNPAGDPGIHMKVQLNCPASADVHRVSVRYGLFKLQPDGTVVTYIPLQANGATKLDSTLDGDFDSGEFGVICPPAYPQNRGTHTWVVRAIVHTRHSKDDPTPFVARVDRRETVDCQ